MSKTDVDSYLYRFVQESNAIEGICREPTDQELMAHKRFLAIKHPRVSSLCDLVRRLQPGAHLRNYAGCDVYVGNYVPPPGSPKMGERLSEILAEAVAGKTHPWIIHNEYETLHPFTDGNGRSGRALWAWQHLNQGWDHSVGIDRGFLHQFYYQTLSHYRHEDKGKEA
jgi:hypothetical protein